MTKHLITCMLLLAGCDKGSNGAPAVSVTQADADAVNALVPADLKDKIAFEVTKIEDKLGRRTTTYTVVAPKGWKKGFMPGSLEPAEESQAGNTLGRTKLKVGSGCDGTCQPKDWAAIVDKVYYAQYATGQVKGKVLKDDKQATRRTMVFQGENTVEQQGNTQITTGSAGTTIITTWWTKDAPRYYECRAELSQPDAGLAAAFEKVCSKVGVSGDD